MRPMEKPIEVCNRDIISFPKALYSRVKGVKVSQIPSQLEQLAACHTRQPASPTVLGVLGNIYIYTKPDVSLNDRSRSGPLFTLFSLKSQSLRIFRDSTALFGAPAS